MRRQEEPVHELPSFARYLHKVFDFRAAAAGLTDSRCEPDIPPSTVFLAAFHGFAFRLPSFQQLEAELTQPALQRWVGADRAFRDDVLRYSLSGFHVEGLERMLVQINRTLKRNKALDTGRVQGRLVAALDGIEVLSSYSRCCDSCLQRRVFVRQGGVKVEQRSITTVPSDARLSVAPASLSWPWNGFSPERARTRPLCACWENFPSFTEAASLTSSCWTRCMLRRRCSNWRNEADGMWLSA
jgi:hypothetical protein